jgi:ribosomal-protein-alanine N-acetyltransferase
MKYLLDKETSERLYFREISNSDFDDWLEFFKHPSSFEHWVAELEAPDIECEKWFNRQAERYKNNEGGMNALIEKKSGKLVGNCGLLLQTVDDAKELEVAYSLLPNFRGHGFATEASYKCIDFAFKNNFSNSLISIISITNLPSANVALKNGMKIEKKTFYKGNSVNIFRIQKTEWLKIKNA